MRYEHRIPGQSVGIIRCCAARYLVFNQKDTLPQLLKEGAGGGMT